MIKKLVSNIFHLDEDQICVFNKRCFILVTNENQAEKIAKVTKTKHVFFSKSPYFTAHYRVSFPIKRLFA